VKAILLAAGFGTRLRPITNKTPKCLVPIAGKPLLEYWLENLKNIGVTKILINTHYLSKMVETFIQKSNYTELVKIVHEKQLLGTAGTLLSNLDFFENKDGILIHADNIWDENIENLMNCYKKRPDSSVLTMLSFRTLSPQSCGIIKVNKKGTIISYEEKPLNSNSNLANGAVFIISPEFQNEIRLMKVSGDDFCKDIIPKFKGKMNAYETKNFFIDVGSIKTYLEANSFFKSKKQMEI